MTDHDLQRYLEDAAYTMKEVIFMAFGMKTGNGLDAHGEPQVDVIAIINRILTRGARTGYRLVKDEEGAK